MSKPMQGALVSARRAHTSQTKSFHHLAHAIAIVEQIIPVGRPKRARGTRRMDEGPCTPGSDRASCNIAATSSYSAGHDIATTAILCERPSHCAAPFSELSDPGAAAPRWRLCIGRLCHCFRAARETGGAVQRSLMLHHGGAVLYELFEHLPNTGSETDFEAAVLALNRHFDPQLNPDYERFKLPQA